MNFQQPDSPDVFPKPLTKSPQSGLRRSILKTSTQLKYIPQRDRLSSRTDQLMNTPTLEENIRKDSFGNQIALNGAHKILINSNKKIIEIEEGSIPAEKEHIKYIESPLEQNIEVTEDGKNTLRLSIAYRNYQQNKNTLKSSGSNPKHENGLTKCGCIIF